MKRKLVWLVITVLMVVSVFSVSAQSDEVLRKADLPDLGSITYPLDTYSLRPTSDIQVSQERLGEVLFPGVMTISPNDSFILEQQEAANVVYSLHFAPIIAPEGTSAETLPELLGQLPLIAYEASALEGMNIAEFDFNGLPAVRVDNVSTDPVEIASHILVLNGSTIVEILVLPARLYGAPNHLAYMTGDAEANRGIAEQIAASFELIQAE